MYYEYCNEYMYSIARIPVQVLADILKLQWTLCNQYGHIFRPAVYTNEPALR